MATYDQLIEQMNMAMLAADDDRVRIVTGVLDRLGHPEQQFKVMHIVGTNGKGSTGTMLAAILQSAGAKVGHFASPAIHNDREQIQVGHDWISEEAFVATYQKIMTQMAGDFQANQLSIFEWFVVIMLQYFADQHVDWAIIEAGLGGQNDATNAITPPLITIFTHIDLDHTAILGNTIKLIVYNKSAVIKPGTHVFVAPNQATETIDIIREQSAHRGARQVTLAARDIEVVQESLAGFDLLVSGRPLHLGLAGNFQIDNLQTVLAVVDWLTEQRLISTVELNSALSDLTIPGRMQIVHQRPTLILDAAHNPDSARRLIETLTQLAHGHHVAIILGFLRDKNYIEMARMYDHFSDDIALVTPINQQRALPATELQQELPNAAVFDDVNEAVQTKLEALAQHDLLVVTGSFYTIKGVRL